MTNKELAERIAKKICLVSVCSCSPNLTVPLRCNFCIAVDRILSILSEYQGEAVGKVTRYDLTTKDGYIFLTDLNKTEKKKISVGAKVYLSAPIKKKCNCYFSEDELKEKAPIKKENK